MSQHVSSICNEIWFPEHLVDNNAAIDSIMQLRLD